MISFPLLDSDLLGFKAPRNPNYFDSGLTVSNTTLAIVTSSFNDEYSNSIVIGCKPNVWSRSYSGMTIADTFPPSCDIQASEIMSSMELGSSRLSKVSSPVSVTSTISSLPSLFASPSMRNFPDTGLCDDLDAISKKCRCFVVKSYSLPDVEASMRNGIWSSTDLGNKRLNQSYIKPDTERVLLFFSVNGSGKFSGVCEMKDKVDFTKSSDIWQEESRWKGIFPVEWLLIKDVPNRFFSHLRIALNEDKPITNSRDTQEVPWDIAVSFLKIMKHFKPKRHS